jgi:hypothetical protein
MSSKGLSEGDFAEPESRILNLIEWHLSSDSGFLENLRSPHARPDALLLALRAGYNGASCRLVELGASVQSALVHSFHLDDVSLFDVIDAALASGATVTGFESCNRHSTLCDAVRAGALRCVARLVSTYNALPSRDHPQLYRAVFSLACSAAESGSALMMRGLAAGLESRCGVPQADFYSAAVANISKAPLQYAAESGAVETAELLFSRVGADAAARWAAGDIGRAALFDAASRSPFRAPAADGVSDDGYTGVARAILARVPAAALGGVLRAARTPSGPSSVSLLECAAAQGNAALVALLLDSARLGAGAADGRVAAQAAAVEALREACSGQHARWTEAHTPPGTAGARATAECVNLLLNAAAGCSLPVLEADPLARSDLCAALFAAAPGADAAADAAAVAAACLGSLKFLAAHGAPPLLRAVVALGLSVAPPAAATHIQGWAAVLGELARRVSLGARVRRALSPPFLTDPATTFERRSAAENIAALELCTDEPACQPSPAAASAAAALGAKSGACGVCGGGDACQPVCVGFCVRSDVFVATVARTILAAAGAHPAAVAQLACGAAVTALAHGKPCLLAELLLAGAGPAVGDAAALAHELARARRPAGPVQHAFEATLGRSELAGHPHARTAACWWLVRRARGERAWAKVLLPALGPAGGASHALLAEAVVRLNAALLRLCLEVKGAVNAAGPPARSATGSLVLLAAESARNIAESGGRGRPMADVSVAAGALFPPLLAAVRAARGPGKDGDAQFAADLNCFRADCDSSPPLGAAIAAANMHPANAVIAGLLLRAGADYHIPGGLTALHWLIVRGASLGADARGLAAAVRTVVEGVRDGEEVRTRLVLALA